MPEADNATSEEPNSPIGGGAASRSSLGLAGDGDELALVDEVERSFGVRFTDEELGACLTAGDLHRLVAKRLPLGDGEGCATALCFYRLRRALQPLVPETPLKPDTLMTVFAQVRPAELYRVIEARTGLSPPHCELSGWAVLVALVGVFGAASGAGFALFSGWAALALIAASLVAAALLPRNGARGIETFANLVEHIASRNTGALARQGARLDGEEAWNALIDIMRTFTGRPHAQITPQTLLIEPR